MDAMKEQEEFLVETTKLVAASLVTGLGTSAHLPAPNVVAESAFEIAQATYAVLKQKGWIGHRRSAA
jgi:hypothetical protein